MADKSSNKITAIFCIDEEAYCLWDTDVHSINMQYLNRIDPEYFGYIALTNEMQLTSDNKHRSATTLRLAFYHSLETMFSLLCSLVQAPDCVVGWMLKYNNTQLRKIVSSISAQRKDYICKLNIEKVNWESLALATLSCSSLSEAEKVEYSKLYGHLWSRFASAFVEDKSITEYNSIKHGLRAGSGGFKLECGIEDQPGVPAPLDKMHLLGAPEFAHTFFKVLPLGSISANPNIQLKSISLAWDPIAMSHALQLISFSINNIVCFLKIINGVEMSTQVFHYPKDKSDFEKPFENTPSVPSMSFQFSLNVPDKDLYTRQNLKEIVSQSKIKWSKPT